jgi:hypothetical protein
MMISDQDRETMELTRRLGVRADKIFIKYGIASLPAIEIERWMRPKMLALLLAHNKGHGGGVPMHHRDDNSVSSIKTRNALLRRKLIRLSAQKNVTVLTPLGRKMVERLEIASERWRPAA